MIVDIILMIILAVSVINGYRKGLVKSLLRLFNIFIFMILFAILYNPIASYLDGSGASAVAVTVAAIVVSSAIEALLCKIVKLPILNQVNRVLGGCLGVVNGMIIIIAFSLLCTYYEAFAPYVADSQLVGFVLSNTESFIIQAGDISGLF